MRPKRTSPAEEQAQQERPLKAGTVTRLEPQVKNPGRVSVYIDGAYAFGLYLDTVATHRIEPGCFLSIPAQESARQADRLQAARAIAVNFVSYRARTEQEVRRKLKQKNFDDTVVEAVVERLHELRYLDDAAYAHAFVRSRFASKGYGPERLRADLIRRGVDRHLVETALSALFEEEDTLAAATLQAEKRWTQFQREPDALKRRKKLYDFLVRRGFDFETARRVVEAFEQRLSAA